jgi:transposase-like protein
VRHPDTVKASALAMWADSKWRISDIADILSVSVRSIHDWTRASGESSKRKPRERTPADVRDQAIAMYLRGRSSWFVADVMGVSQTAVLRWVRAAGHSTRPKGRVRA